MIEDLRKQLEHLQLFKLEAEQRRGRGSSMGLQEYNSRTRESELEQEVRRLKQVRAATPLYPCRSFQEPSMGQGARRELVSEPEAVPATPRMGSATSGGPPPRE